MLTLYINMILNGIVDFSMYMYNPTAKSPHNKLNFSLSYLRSWCYNIFTLIFYVGTLTVEKKIVILHLIFWVGCSLKSDGFMTVNQSTAAVSITSLGWTVIKKAEKKLWRCRVW